MTQRDVPSSTLGLKEVRRGPGSSGESWGDLVDPEGSRGDLGVPGGVSHPRFPAMTQRDVPGFAIGGLSGGEDKAQFWRTVKFSAEHLPRDKPRYLMGVG